MNGTNYTTLATGTTQVANGNLGLFDPTLLVNGVYEIRLTINQAGGTYLSTSVHVVVDGRLKIGNFTLTFNNLTVPVADIPIQVNRTYDSRNKAKGDFGVGWTLDIANIKVEKTVPEGSAWTSSMNPGCWKGVSGRSTCRPRNRTWWSSPSPTGRFTDSRRS